MAKQEPLKVITKIVRGDEVAFYEQVRELMQANAEGRLVVLPCAVAEEVEYKSAVDEGKARKGKVIAISMLLSESVRRMEMQVMIKNGAVIPFEKNDFEKGVLRRGKEESEAALEKMGGSKEWTEKNSENALDTAINLVLNAEE